MRKPTQVEFTMLKYVRNVIADMVIPFEQEGTILEAMVRLVAHEEHLDAEQTAFLICLALGNVTEDNWDEQIIPF